MLSAFFGHDLSDYRGALVLLIFGGGLNAAAMLLYYGLTTMRRQRQILICYGVSALAAFVLSPMLVTKLGLLGGAACYTGAMGLLVLLFLVSFRRQYRKAVRSGK